MTQASHRRKRVLLSAFYWSPYRGGEAAVGWNYSVGLARDHDVTVLCGDFSGGKRWEADVARARAEGIFPDSLRILGVDASAGARLFHRAHGMPGCWFLYYKAYQLWQKAALRVAESLHAEKPFDLAHQLTIITCREPGYLHRLGIPWFWGPINGAALMPWRYLPTFGISGAYRHATRNVLNLLQTRLAGRPRRAARRAAALWVVTREDQAMARNWWGVDAMVEVETGATPTDAPTKVVPAGQPLRFVWCGIIEARKALHLLLRALADAHGPVAWKLDVIGNGPDESRCRNEARQLGLEDRIHWRGRVPHDEAKRIMADGHLLIHSSLKEGTPHVVLEALAAGLPVLCHDACGMGIVVDETCGIKIPLRSPAESILGFRRAVERFLENPGIIEALSAGALARARALSWENKMSAITSAYARIPDHE